MGSVKVFLLGPVEVRVDGTPVALPGGRPAAVLTMLALAEGATVALDSLVEHIWAGRLDDARNAVAVTVSRLRKVVGVDAVVAEAGGYRLAVPAADIDVCRFTALVEAADGEADPATRLARVAEALDLWRGEPLAGTVDLPMVTGRLQELRLRALELAAELRLDLGQHERVAAELPSLVFAHPLRERLTALLMLARYRANRQSEALQAFDHLRTTLSRELGVDPGPAVRRLYQQILEGDPALDEGRRPAVPAQLPPRPPALVGRSDELAALAPLSAGDASIGVVTGPAGVGKTALALAWAHCARDAFPGGQLYLDLNGFGPGEPVSPHDAVSTLLRGLRVTETDQHAALEARSAVLRTALAGRRVLVVLDNARDSAQVRPLLPGSGSAALVTSRRRLSGLTTRHAATRVALDALPAEDALRLLAGVVGQDRVGAEPAAAATVAALCDRLPLATVIAAERMACAPGVPISEFATDLTDRRLATLEAGDDPAAGIRTVLSWSLDALAVPARTFLRLLAAHPAREFDLAAAAATAGVPLPQARRLTEELATLHLLQRVAGNRLTRHDLVHAYTVELLDDGDPADRTGARLRLLAWYQHTLAAACGLLDPRARPVPLAPLPPDLEPLTFTSRADALWWCEAERHALLAVAEAAADAGRHDAVQALAELHWTYLDMRGRPNEVRAVCQRALTSAQAAGDVEAEARQLNRLGIACLLLADFDGAERHCRAALAIDHARGDHLAKAETLTNLARIMTVAGHPREAVRCCRRALALVPHPETAWRSWNNLAMAQHLADDDAGAQESVERALRAAELHGRTGGRERSLDAIGMSAYTRDTRGQIHLALARPAEALADFRYAHHIAVELGEWGLEAGALIGVGRALHVQGHTTDAHQIWSKALDIYHDVEAHAAAESLRRTIATCCPAPSPFAATLTTEETPAI